MKLPTTAFHGLIALAALAIPLSSANAVLIADEYFDYGESQADLRNLNGGSGWAGGWASDATFNTNGVRIDYYATNLTASNTGYSNAGNIGGSAGFASNTASGAVGAPRLFASNLTQSDLWFSAVVYAENNNDRALLWVGSNATSAGGAANTFLGIEGGTTWYRYNGNSTTGSAGLVTAGNTYLLIGRVQLDVSGTSDAFSYWFNPGDVTSVGALGAASFTVSGNNAFGTSIAGIGIQFGTNATAGGNGTARLDAIRVGTDLASVVVPEPSGSLLAAIGLGGLLLARRRRL